jgi:hypothetical protein
MVYRAALAAYLRSRYPLARTVAQLSARSMEFFCEDSATRAVRRAIGIPERAAVR